jgi:hypothetical protein
MVAGAEMETGAVGRGGAVAVQLEFGDGEAGLADEIGGGGWIVEEGGGEAGGEEALDVGDGDLGDAGTAGDVRTRDLAWRRGRSAPLILGEAAESLGELEVCLR